MCCQGAALPGPLPLGVAVIDTAIMLFGQAFPSVALKHRQQLLTHFRESIRQAKSARQQSIQINIFTAFLVALKVRITVCACARACVCVCVCVIFSVQNLVDTKSVLGQQDILTNAYGLISVSTQYLQQPPTSPPCRVRWRTLTPCYAVRLVRLWAGCPRLAVTLALWRR